MRGDDNDPVGKGSGSLTDDQVSFLEDDLSSTKKFWKVVVLYNPMPVNEAHAEAL